MRKSTRLGDATHILVLILLNPGRELSSAVIATSVCTNPSYVRRLMASLKAAGLLDCRPGRATPLVARPPERISLLDVYRAVEGDAPLLRQDGPHDPHCGAGADIGAVLGGCFDEVQRQAERAMSAISLADVAERVRDRLHARGVDTTTEDPTHLIGGCECKECRCRNAITSRA